MKKDIIQTFISICVVIGIVLGAISYFAKAEELKLVEMRLDQKIVSDQLHETKDQMRELEKANKSRNFEVWKDERDKKDYLKLMDELEELKLKREKLLKK